MKDAHLRAEHQAEAVSPFRFEAKPLKKPLGGWGGWGVLFFSEPFFFKRGGIFEKKLPSGI